MVVIHAGLQGTGKAVETGMREAGRLLWMPMEWYPWMEC